MPCWLRAAGISRDGTRISLMSDTLSGCEAAMRAGIATFLLCHRAPGGLGAPDFRELVVGHDTLVAVAAPGLQRSRPRLDYGERSGLRRIIVSNRPPDDGSAPADGTESAFTSPLASVLHELVCHGEGWAWLPLGMAGDDLDAGRLVRRDLEPIPLDIVLLRPEAPLDPISEAFWDAASRTAPLDERTSAALSSEASEPPEGLSPPAEASGSG